MHEVNSFSIASSEDFIANNKDDSSEGGNSRVLQIFPYPNSDNFYSTVIRKQCERYCGQQMSCLGCTLNCTFKDTRSCQWEAVTSCKNDDESKSLIGIGITQKPGKKNNQKITKNV